ncbi:MAG TPA: glycine/sarcosine/betaine reductase selenoprotein B family protein [Desulfomonilia bacterium]|nr:glycine/sarcosine/betaine reductase selenoprotein B family protein [Desulfomonilia bacterium]
MLTPARLKNKFISKMISRFPSVAKHYIDAYKPWESKDIPWAPVKKPLSESRVALVTTAGVHRKDQTPFNMHDTNGDPTFRKIERDTPVSDLTITHDYYDHTDADRDINIVFPVERLRELASKGLIGSLAQSHYGFMGHITGPHIYTLSEVSAPEVASRMKKQEVDCVLLTPG